MPSSVVNGGIAKNIGKDKSKGLVIWIWELKDRKELMIVRFEVCSAAVMFYIYFVYCFIAQGLSCNIPALGESITTNPKDIKKVNREYYKLYTKN